MLNLSLIAADISVAANLKKSSNQVAGSSSSAYLNSACALAVTCAYVSHSEKLYNSESSLMVMFMYRVMAFATAVADTVKIFGDRAHKRDFDEQFEYQRSGPIHLA
jgi:hypothetical protein